MGSRHRNRPFVVFAFSGLAVWALACGSESSGRKYDGGSPGAGGTGASPQTSVGSGGAIGAGGVLGAGGVVGAGAGPEAGTGAVDATDVVVPLNSGPDAPAVDARLDAALDAAAADVGAESAAQPCGDAACSPGQACVLKAGGPVPPCDPPSDAGTCPDWLVLVASCGGNMGPSYRAPGCTTPPPSPRCYDVPGACEDLCSCVCGLSFGFGCNPGPGYFLCSYP